MLKSGFGILLAKKKEEKVVGFFAVLSYGCFFFLIIQFRFWFFFGFACLMLL